MNFKAISDSDLLEQTKRAVLHEREATAAVLRHLEEIEARRLYLERGYSSLFEMCLQEFGYSGGAAQRRIASMRCLRSLGAEQRADVEEKLEQGALTLSHLSQVESVARAEGIRTQDKIELLESVEGTSVRECEKKLAALHGVAAPARPVLRVVAPDQTRLSLTLDDETVELLEKFQSLTSHQNPKRDPATSLKLALKAALAKIDPERKVRPKKKVNNLAPSELPKAAADSLPAPEVRTRHIPNPIKRMVWNRDRGQCSYLDRQTGRRCASRHLLQVDHVKPYALGGAHTPENLRLLCHAHHQRETERGNRCEA